MELPLTEFNEPEEEYNVEKTANPFSFDLKLKAIKLVEKKDLRGSEDLTKVDGLNIPADEATHLEASVSSLIDASPSCKVFRDPGVREIISGLEGTNLRLFTCLSLKLGRNRDTIRIDAETYMETMGVTKKTFYKAVSALIRYGVIARYKKNIFWINPAILFNGNRLSKYREKVEVIGINVKKP